MTFRKSNIKNIIFLVFIIFIFAYGFITLQDNQLAIDSKDHEINKLRDDGDVLKEQLKVVYHHTQRIEEELKKERERHKNTRSELLNNKRELLSNISKSKHESWTRFNALDSDHKMLRVEHEETKTTLALLEAQYKRLSSDHQRIIKQNKEDFENMKDSKDRESLSLQDRIQELYKKNTYFQQLAAKNEEYYLKLKEHFTNCTRISKNYKELLQKQLDEKRTSKLNHDKPTQHIAKLHSALEVLQSKNSELEQEKEKSKNPQTESVKPDLTRVRTKKSTENEIPTSQTQAFQKGDVEDMELLETPPPGADKNQDVANGNTREKEKKDPLILRPIVSKKGKMHQIVEDEKLNGEGLDAQKVTFEDDENGDQNLDKHEKTTNEGGDDVEGNGKKDDEEMEEKFPNILEN